MLALMLALLLALLLALMLKHLHPLASTSACSALFLLGCLCDGMPTSRSRSPARSRRSSRSRSNSRTKTGGKIRRAASVSQFEDFAVHLETHVLACLPAAWLAHHRATDRGNIAQRAAAARVYRGSTGHCAGHWNPHANARGQGWPNHVRAGTWIVDWASTWITLVIVAAASRWRKL